MAKRTVKIHMVEHPFKAGGVIFRAYEDGRPLYLGHENRFALEKRVKGAWPNDDFQFVQAVNRDVKVGG